MSQKDDVDAPVLGAAVLGSVAGDGMKLGVTCGGEVNRVDGTAFQQQAGDGGGACGGELPVGGELRGVDGDIVGVAFDSELARGQGGGEDGERRDGGGADFGRTGREESGLVEGDDEAVSE